MHASAELDRALRNVDARQCTRAKIAVHKGCAAAAAAADLDDLAIPELKAIHCLEIELMAETLIFVLGCERHGIRVCAVAGVAVIHLRPAANVECAPGEVFEQAAERDPAAPRRMVDKFKEKVGQHGGTPTIGSLLHFGAPRVKLAVAAAVCRVGLASMRTSVILPVECAWTSFNGSPLASK